MSDRLTDEDLTAIEAREQAATPGPWVWRAHTVTKWLELKSLATLPRMYHPIILQPRRWGMMGATLWWRNAERDAMEPPCLVADAPHHPTDIVALDHPDARFIAGAREDVPRLLAEVRTLRAEVEAAEQRGYERALADVGALEGDGDDGLTAQVCGQAWLLDRDDYTSSLAQAVAHLRGECCCPKEQGE